MRSTGGRQEVKGVHIFILWPEKLSKEGCYLPRRRNQDEITNFRENVVIYLGELYLNI